MAERSDAVAVLERIRELETESASLLRGLASLPEDAPGRSLRAVEVTVGGCGYLVPVDSVVEVVAMMWPQPLPDAPEWVMGTFQFGATTVPLVDLSLRLLGEPSVLGPDLQVMVSGGSHKVGLVVSQVGGVTEVDSTALSTPGPTVPCAPFVLGTLGGEDGASVHLLSVDRLSRELPAAHREPSSHPTEDHER